MSWISELQPASFRGVEFKVESTDSSLGRRNVTHEYPKRDVPFTEDLGRQADEFNFTAFIIGDDTGSTRRALMDAIRNKNTPGTLIHPLYGSVQVIPKGCRHRIDFNKDRIEYFELTFSEAGTNQYPSALDDTKTLVSDAGETVVETMTNIIGTVVTVDGLPQFVSDDAQSIGGDVVTSVTAAAGKKTRDADATADLLESLSTFEADLSNQVADPETMATNIFDLVLRVQDVYSDARDGFQAFLSLMDFGSTYPAIPTTTSTRRQQATNQRMLVSATKQAALIGLAKTASEIDFVSYDEAVATRNQLHDYFDDELLNLGATDDDQAYLDLDGLRAAMVKDITSRAANLERVKNIVPKRSLPALVTSYDLYKTANRADEIVARNKVSHPGFLPAGRNLQVLVG